MNDFNEKFKEYESKNKKANRTAITITIIGLLIFAGLFMYNIYLEKEKQKDEEIIFKYNNEQIKETEIKDSINYIQKIKREDSLQQALKMVQSKINEIKNDKGINNTLRQKINLIQAEVNNIKAIARDTIVVRYYKRKADGNLVEKAIRSINDPSFHINYRKVPNDDGQNKVNTLYFGKNLNKKYVDVLYNKLIENNVQIEYLKPFLSARGFEWKQNAIEIGFEKTASNINENAKTYIRIYSFKPNNSIKIAIRNKLEAQGFPVTLYPDWPEKPSFFSNKSTVLYYHATNKDKAVSIAKTLTELINKMSVNQGAVTDFDVKMGGGYGVGENEKKHLFIIHYNGN
ncbi:LytR C-terminal domain-containing protein [Tamlana sp. I1]|uniref:LytR C-terminal domain-containing protein n=1 Tax=Tamlana sp. I1 TaxID=2762061 RepID=UPI00188E7486|nr:LytR C-terminal domain-containing protein [Tamlana sp. I1]